MEHVAPGHRLHQRHEPTTHHSLIIRLNTRRELQNYPSFMEGFDLDSLNRRQFAHWTGSVQAARINCGTTPYRGAGSSGLLPFFHEGFQTNLTRFPVIWFAKNDFEGNVAGLNHVTDKYPKAASYRYIIASWPLSKCPTTSITTH